MRIRRLAILIAVGLPLLFVADTSGQRPRADSSFVNGRQHEGEVLDADLPGGEHIKNIGSHVPPHAGMCVMSSIEMAARYAGLEQYRGLRDWCAREDGGANPPKVDDQLKRFAVAKGIKPAPYLQYTGPDPRPILDRVAKNGQLACITYGYSPRYERPISHMVCAAKWSGKWAVVLDNNYPGVDRYEWMSQDEMVKRICAPRGNGWVFAWVVAPPPPPPSND